MKSIFIDILIMKHINMIKYIRDVLLQNIASNRKIQYNFHCTTYYAYIPFICSDVIFSNQT